MTVRPMAFEQGRTDVVTAVVIPIDGVTRLPVHSGLDAQLWDPVRQAARPNRLIRNLSGYIVLVNERANQDLTFRIEPTAAGYRGPLFVTFNPASDGVSRVVALEPRPDSVFDETATLVRGSVVRSGGGGSPLLPQPVSGLTVTAKPPAAAADHQFPATTNERGVFALVVGLNAPATSEDHKPVRTVLRFEKTGLPVREFAIDLDRGRTHTFAAAVDLDRADHPPWDRP
jgi:hypothetical protein